MPLISNSSIIKQNQFQSGGYEGGYPDRFPTVLKVKSQQLPESDEAYILVSNHMTLREFRKLFDNLFNVNKDKVAFQIRRGSGTVIRTTPLNYEENKDNRLSAIGLTFENVALQVFESDLNVRFEDTEQVGSYPGNYNINDSGDDDKGSVGFLN